MATVIFNGKKLPVIDFSEIGAHQECAFEFKGKIFYRNGNAVTPITDKHCTLIETKKRIAAIKERQNENAKAMSR